MAKPVKANSAAPKQRFKKAALLKKKPPPKRSKMMRDVDPAEQLRRVAAGHLPPQLRAQADVLDRLWRIIDTRKEADPELSHSARLLARGPSRVAQKMGEEAIECLIEAVAGNRAGTIAESADLLYHLLVVWVHAGIEPQEVWQELQNRERVSYLSTDPKGPIKRLVGTVNIGTTKIP
jgi:phosphoribosyl-ATP pyrophosphohydrolase